MTWYWNLVLSLPIAFAVAVASWWLIERPSLRARYLLDKIDTWRTTRKMVQLSS